VSEALPLSGKCIVVTRPRHQSRPLAEALRALGARVIEAPAIGIEPPADFRALDGALDRLEQYDWVVFTSANAVDAFFDRRASLHADRPLPAVRFAAIGPATAESLAERGAAADVVPDRFVAEEVFRALARREDPSGKRFLLPRADIAREALPDLLRKAGGLVDVVEAYRTLPVASEVRRAAELVETGAVDIVTFTSASTARSFFTGVDPGTLRGRFAAASIGPITSGALREFGVEPRIEAENFSTEGLVEAIARFCVENG
jgi:uroporphyrinogen-III synthase